MAKYGDGWMASAYNITPDKFKEKWSAIRSYGRNFGKELESLRNQYINWRQKFTKAKYFLKDFSQWELEKLNHV